MLVCGAGKDAAGQAATPGAAPVFAVGGSIEPRAKGWAIGRLWSAPAFRIAAVAVLFLWGGFDQVHFALGTDEGNLPALARAARMNPYDSSTEERIANADSQVGRRGDAVAALTRAVEINPHRIGLQEACARAMIEDGRYADAYAHYKTMLAIFPKDADALVNYGLLAARLGHPEEAMDSWQKAADANPHQANAQLYLAEAFDQGGEYASAARHWKGYLDAAAAASRNDDATASSSPPKPAEIVSAMIQLADDEAHLNQAGPAEAEYQAAASLADYAGEAGLQSLALAHLADLQEKAGNPRGAAESYQRSLALDAKVGAVNSGGARNEASDWFNYGQFLRRRGMPEDLVYACFLHAENLLANSAGQDCETVHTERLQIEARLGKKAAADRKDAAMLLARAASLPTESF